MLDTPKKNGSSRVPEELLRETGQFDDDGIDVHRLLSMARRHAVIVVVCATVGLIAGVGYLLTARPLYTASTHILIEKNKVQSFENIYDLSGLGNDSSAVNSQVELLKSEKIGLSVIRDLKLLDHPEFAQASESFFGETVSTLKTWLLATMGSDNESFRDHTNTDASNDIEVSSEERREREILKELGDSLKIQRVARTYVLDIRYTSPNPGSAAAIANGFAKAYLADQLDSRYDATKRASEWLQERIAELKQQSLESDLAVQQFKAQRNLVVADGRLLSDQQLGELNSKLVLTRSETATKEARYLRIQEIINNGQTEAIVTEAIGNNIIDSLRAKFLDAAKREAEISIKLGKDHLQAANLRAEMDELKRQMFDELGRIAESYKSEFEIAKSLEKALLENMENLSLRNQEVNQDLVTLREMERESTALRNLYQTFLQRYQEAVQGQSFPVTEARVITNATPPLRPSHPRKALSLALFLLLGSGVGAGIATLRELRDRVFRTAKEVRDVLGVEFIGNLQRIPESNESRSSVGNGTAVETTTAQGIPICRPSGTMRYVLDAPFTGYAETLRGAKVAVDLTLQDKTPKIVGITSIFPSEGKSTTSKNFATLISHLGANTILIDCDLRNPGLTRSVVPGAKAGLVEAIVDDKPLNELWYYEEESQLTIVPTVLKRRISHTSEMVSSPMMRRILEEAGNQFDYVVLDLPPLSPVVDVRALATRVDGFILVVEWGKVSRQVVKDLLEADRNIYDRLIGVVYNKVDTKKLKLYEDYGSGEYYYGTYSNYYTD